MVDHGSPFIVHRFEVAAQLAKVVILERLEETAIQQMRTSGYDAGFVVDAEGARIL